MAPLPAFVGDPYLVPLAGVNPAEIALNLWSNLNKENRVAIAVKSIDSIGKTDVQIINKYKSMEA